MTPRQLIDTALLGLALTFGSVHAHALPVLERVLDQPCRAIALDREPYVAALGNDSVTVFDKRGSHQEALPEALRGKDVNVGIFFGRDYRVRIAGSAHTQKGDEVRYYRSLPTGIKSALDEIGPIVGRSSSAARQLASRARRRVRGTQTRPADLPRQRRVVDAYLAAVRDGDFEGLLRLLDPDVVLRADAGASPAGRLVELRGAEVVARAAMASSARAR